MNCYKNKLFIVGENSQIDMDIISLKYKILRRLSMLVYRNNHGIYVCDEEWDNLIILDACRFDIFKDAFSKGLIQGNLEYRISRGSCTPEFLLENFSNRDCKDVIYITGNPYVDMYLKDSFFKVISVWNNGWNEKYNTVLPMKMYEATLHAARKYPDKRFIIHFMQPHYPFLTDPLGDTGIKYLRESMLGRDEASKEINVWGIIERKKIDLERVRKAYVNNLHIALPYVSKLLRILRGINVVTADHGNVLGEVFWPILPLKIYGHPCNFRMENLIKVPWLVYDNTSIDSLKVNSVVEKELIKIKLKKIKQAKNTA